MTRRAFLWMHLITLKLGVVFLVYMHLEYDEHLSCSQSLKQASQALLKSKSFKLTPQAQKVYEKIFNSTLAEDDLIYELQNILEKMALRYETLLEDINIKKQAEVASSSHFLVAIKIKSCDDRSIYQFIKGIEDLEQLFTRPQCLQLSKVEKLNNLSNKSWIEGEYVFEIYVKS